MNSTGTQNPGKTIITVEEAPVSRFLFSDVRFSWFWLILRVYVGYEWLSAGWEKLTGAGWVGAGAGTSLTGFVNNAIKLTTGAHPSVQTWYAWFLQHFVIPLVVPWSYAVTLGELLVGIGLILGIFTGLAAFFGGFMNVNYLLAGSLSTNPFLFVFATWLVLAWKTAGWLGFDRWILPVLGTPWRPGRAFHSHKEAKPAQTTG